ncbi:centromere protein Q-like isoform X2 [Ranitomeya imitator]|uniref:centromere protein Q-like isoform X2 n=1 Tax=Ranitomeya imitator TaxID=111125 RepID=UPI0037E8ED1D
MHLEGSPAPALDFPIHSPNGNPIDRKMAPKRERTVKLSSDTRVKNRKMQGSGEQTSGKRQSSNSTNDKDVWLLKRQNAGPLHTAVLEHIEACLTVAEMSVLSRKRFSAIKYRQHPLSNLKQRLLKFCKKIRLPVTKVHKVKNLAKDILEEQHKMNVYEDTLECLEHEIEKTVVTVEKIEDSIVALEGKVEAMKKHASKTSQFQDKILSNIDPLELPQGTFEAPTMQDMAKKLKNPKLLLKAVSRVQSRQIYKNALNLLKMSYAETSSLLPV